MRNLVIGIIVVLVIIIGGWYVMSGSKQASVPQAPLVQEEMVACPVTGEKIYPSQAFAKTEYKGKTYYFCCAGCPEEFAKDPEKYINKDKQKEHQH